MRVRNRNKVEVLGPPIEVGGSNIVSPWFLTYDEADSWRPDGMAMPPRTQEITQLDEMVDEVTPNFHRRKAEGELLPTLDCYASSNNVVFDEVRFAVHQIYREGGLDNPSGRYRSYYTWMYKRFQVTAPNVGREPNLGYLLAKARSKMQSGFMDALTSASELHKTIEMVIGFKKRLRECIIKLVKSAKRKGLLSKVRTFKQFMEVLAQYWLEFRFGWRILWYEYNSIVDVVNSLDTDFVRRSFREGDGTSDVSSGEWEGRGLIQFRKTTSVTDSFRAGCTGTVRPNHRLLLDPLTTAWELLPLSFVIDMAWNVGDVITATSPFGTINEDDAWYSWLQERSVSQEYRPNFVPSTHAHYSSPIVDEWEVKRSDNISTRKVYRRVKADSSFIWPSPNFDPSWSQLLDLGSLVVLLHELALDVLPGGNLESIKRNRL